MDIKAKLHEAFGEQFMQPDIEECDYFDVETTHGTTIVPADLIGRDDRTVGEVFAPDEEDGTGLVSSVLSNLAQYVEGDVLSATYRHGWLARLSASGYMDCTDWSAFSSYDEAAEYLIDTYGDES